MGCHVEERLLAIERVPQAQAQKRSAPVELAGDFDLSSSERFNLGRWLSSCSRPSSRRGEALEGKPKGQGGLAVTRADTHLQLVASEHNGGHHIGD